MYVSFTSMCKVPRYADDASRSRRLLAVVGVRSTTCRFFLLWFSHAVLLVLCVVSFRCGSPTSCCSCFVSVRASFVLCFFLAVRGAQQAVQHLQQGVYQPDVEGGGAGDTIGGVTVFSQATVQGIVSGMRVAFRACFENRRLPLLPLFSLVVLCCWWFAHCRFLARCLRW